MHLGVTNFNKSPIPQSSAVTILDARSSESGDTSNWVWSPWSLAVFRCGGLAASFGSVTWQNHKAAGSSANHWSGYGRGNSDRGSSAMVAGLSGAVSGIQRGISPQITLTVLNIRQQIPQKHPHPWRLLWVP